MSEGRCDAVRIQVFSQADGSLEDTIDVFASEDLAIFRELLVPMFALDRQYVLFDCDFKLFGCDTGNGGSD